MERNWEKQLGKKKGEKKGDEQNGICAHNQLAWMLTVGQWLVNLSSRAQRVQWLLSQRCWESKGKNMAHKHSSAIMAHFGWILVCQVMSQRSILGWTAVTCHLAEGMRCCFCPCEYMIEWLHKPRQVSWGPSLSKAVMLECSAVLTCTEIALGVCHQSPYPVMSQHVLLPGQVAHWSWLVQARAPAFISS